MKCHKCIFSFVLITLSFSCNNPHLSKKSSKAKFDFAVTSEETNNPASNEQNEQNEQSEPSQPDTISSNENEVSSTSETTWYVSLKQDGDVGKVVTGFAEAIKKAQKEKQYIKEDFESFKEGKNYLQLTNSGRYEHFYELTHKVQKKIKSKVTGTQLEDFVEAKNYRFAIENPLKQNGVKSKKAGLDSLSAGPFSVDVIQIDFRHPINFFGVDTLDFESTTKHPASLRLFDCDKKLIEEQLITYPHHESGQKEQHFIGFLNQKIKVCSLLISVGNHKKINTKGLRAIGIENFYYGYADF